MRIFPRERDLSEPVSAVELTVRGSDLQVPPEEVQVRLDMFLQRFLSWRSRTSIQRLIKDGYVWLDAADPGHPKGSGRFERELRPGRRLLHGARLRIDIPEPLRVQRASPAATDLAVIYEDQWITAVDKPPLLPVHPSGRHLSDTLIQRVHARYGEEAELREFRTKLCHRLDRETSGLVLLGRDPDVHTALMKAFEEREIDKEYLAICWGQPTEERGFIDFPIGSDRSSEVRIKMACTLDGQEAQTAWRVVERLEGACLIAASPKTGRQHQIRVHLSAIGLPLVGDKLYCEDESRFLRGASGELTDEDAAALRLPRHALHNAFLGFVHPVTGERVELRSELPADMAECVQRLRPAQR
jgi:23S rRNA pseudouridine1911/1915/1917 synthase